MRRNPGDRGGSASADFGASFGGFPDFERGELGGGLGGGEMGAEFFEDDLGDIFDGGVEGLKFRAVDIEMFVIEDVDDVGVDDFLELVNREDDAGDGIRFGGEGDFEDVVVAVTGGVVAAAEDVDVLLRGQR